MFFCVRLTFEVMSVINLLVLFTRRLSIYAIPFIILIFSASAHAELKPGSQLFREYGTIIGSWGGREGLEGPKIEMALWRGNRPGLVGVLIWGECSVDIYVEMDTYWVQKRALKYKDLSGDVKSTINIYKVSYRNQISFDNTKCAKVVAYKRALHNITMFMASDENYKSLYIHKNRQFVYADHLQRIPLSNKLAQAIKKTQILNKLKLSEASKPAICDPATLYTRLITNPQSSRERTSAGCKLLKTDNNLMALSRSTWMRNYETSGITSYYIYKGDFLNARKLDLYYTGFISLIEGYNLKCATVMDMPKTIITIKSHTIVKPKYGGEYEKNHHSRSVSVPTRYVDTYNRAKTRAKKEPWSLSKLLAMRNETKAFIESEGGCSSVNTKRLLENYYRSINNLPPL